MEMVIDDLDDFEYENGIISNDDTTTQDSGAQELDSVESSGYNASNQETSDDDFISSLLKSRGIDDRTKIKFENEEGSVEEVDWDNLSNEDRLNILNSSALDPTKDLDDSEIQLINAIRHSGMSPSEYLQYVQTDGVNRYIQNSQASNYSYSIDQYNDEDLYVYDLMSRAGMTVEEAQEALERAKSNEALFTKLMGAIRNEYKEAEREQLQTAQIELERLAQEQFNQFANSIADQISLFKDFSGYNIDMDNEDMQELYDFITGVDAAGNNHFAKALADPGLVVQMAYFTLNGKRLIDDITDYFLKEITNVGRESYAKGVADAQKKDNSNVVFKDKQRPTKRTVEIYSDLDDF